MPKIKRRGFFPQSTLLQSKRPQSLVPKCGACGLYKTCKTPKMGIDGKGKRRILIVSEAPSENEDEKGRPLLGASGQYLSDTLRRYGVDMRRDCYLYNALICRPPNNAAPDHKQIDYCRPNLIRTINETDPDIIIPLGQAAVTSLMGHVWKDDVGKLIKWVGWAIPCQKPNVWICPTWHPSHISRQKNPVTEMYFRKHIKKACELSGKPWKEVPNNEEKVEIIFDADKAAAIIRKMIERGGNVAFDYETNMLKPDSPRARVISASVCWNGKRTIAYPWHGAAIEASRDLLREEAIGKIASNLKFEERWTIRLLKTKVRGWIWDTMLAAHVLDNRPEITSIKFQGFVHLGQEVYDDHIKPFLKAPGSQVNRIVEEIELKKLLLYCGLDSLLEYEVAKVQQKLMGIKGGL